MKIKVAEALNTLGKVNGTFVTYTKHDISHVNKMLEMLDWIIPPVTKKNMTTVDWLMIVLSIYFHDFGMIVTSEEYNRRNENQLFQEFLIKLNMDSESKDYLDRTEKMSPDEKEKFFYQEFVRSQHAIRIREWITSSVSRYWGDSIKPLTDEIGDSLKKLPIRFKQNLADICESHHKDNLDDIKIYPLCQRYGDNKDELANVQYSALILRTADLLHITKDRTPSVMYKIIHFSDPKSVDEWNKQSGTFSVHMKSREYNETDPDSHIIKVSADFKEERPFFSLTEYVTYANDQIIQSKRWADNSQKNPDGKNYIFPWQGVIGDIRVEGNAPHQMSFKLDRGRLLNLLVGHTIYNDPKVAIRELLQNSIDAVRYEYYLSKKNIELSVIPQPEMGQVLVKWDPDKRELIVEDNGIGMDRDIIEYHLMRVGSSFYNTPKFQAENSDYSPISRFGIGILTCFMISDDIEIITCRKDGGHRIKMSSVQGSYLLKKLDTGSEILEGLEPHGTRVKLMLRQSIDTKEESILDIIRHWIILPECKVIYAEKGKEKEIIGFDNPSKALEYFTPSIKDVDTEIINKLTTENGSTYELAFAVSHSTFAPEKNFVSYHENEKSIIPAVCVEGVRVDEKIPGFSRYEGITAMLSVKGNKTLQTTVSRTGLEKDTEYIKIGKICTKLFSNYVQDEVERISQQKGEPLSQASTACIRLRKVLKSSVSSKEISEYLDELNSKIPIIVIENTKHKDSIVTSRDLISEEKLKKLSTFWAIESRLVDSLGIISRDLGRELSLNDFLGKLAPELLDNRINPILSDAHLFKNIILSSHQLHKVEFSQKNQQTLMRWELKKEISTDNCHFIKLLNDKDILDISRVLDKKDSLERSSYLRDNRQKWEILDRICVPLLVAPIEGDIKKVRGIKTRLVTVLNPASQIVSVFQILEEAMKKIETYNVIDMDKIVNFSYLITKMVNTHYQKRFDKNYNCNMYIPINSSDHQSRRPYSSLPDLSINYISWQESTAKINKILDNTGIDKRIEINIDEFFDEGEVFDASRYWLDWGVL